MKGYCQIEDIENYLLTDVDLSFYDQVEEWIEAMEGYIEKKTGRVFVADKMESEKKYDGNGEDEMFIDDAVEILKVEVDGEEIEFLSYPANSTPKTKIKRKDGVFTRGLQNVAVTAKWGYSVEAPADIKMATVVLTAGIINRSLSHEGEIQSKAVGPYSVTYKTEKEWDDFEKVEDTLKQYKRYIF